MTTWFTADSHFGHTKIIEYVKRPFDSIDQMDEELIKRWNSRVKKDDIVYHLGDFTLSNMKGFEYYIEKLNGLIVIIPGGHDHRWLKDYRRNGTDVRYSVMSSLFTIKVRGMEFVLCHYPLISWNKSVHGVIHLHGHVHGNLGCLGRSTEGSGAKPGYRVDVGVDCWDFYPISIPDIVNRIDAYEGIVKV